MAIETLQEALDYVEPYLTELDEDDQAKDLIDAVKIIVDELKTGK